MKKLLSLTVISALCFFASAQEEQSTDITVEVKNTNGTVSGTTYTSSANPGVRVSIQSGHMWSTYNNSGENIVIGTLGGTRSVTIESTSIYYYVSAFSMQVSSASTDPVRFTLGETQVVSNTTEQPFIGTFAENVEASFTVRCNNDNELSHDKKATLGNFVVTLSRKTSQIDFASDCTTLKTEALNALQGMQSILKSSTYSSLYSSVNNLTPASVTTEDEYNTFTATISNALNTAYGEIDGRIVTIYNNRALKYLTVVGGNTVPRAQKTNASIWRIVRKGSENSFTLQNLDTRTYIATSRVDSQSNNQNNARLFKLSWSTPNNANIENGSALAFADGTNGMVMGGSRGATDANNPVTTWDGWTINDGGAPWTIALVGEQAENLDTTGATVYRIRSARAVNKNVHSLLGINTVAEDNAEYGATQTLVARDNGLGALWTIHAASDGKVFLRNIAADFEGNDSPFALSSANPTGYHCGSSLVSDQNNIAVTIMQADGAPGNTDHFERNIPQALCIQTYNNGSNYYYLDSSNDGTPSFNGWDRVNNDWPNNGGVYFFEALADAELQSLTESYISSANSKTFATGIQDALNNARMLPLFWEKNNIDKAQDSLESTVDPSSDASTVKEANSRVNEVTDRHYQILDPLYKTAENKPFIAWNYDRHGDNNANYYLAFVDTCSFGNASKKYNVVGASLDKTALASHWTLEYQSNGKYFIKNYLNNRYAGYNATENEPFQTSETAGNLYEVLGYTANSDTIVGFKTEGRFMHQTDNNSKDYIVCWNVPSATSNQASGWYVASAEADDHAAELLAESTATRITFTVDGATLSKHEAYGNHHAITITKQPTEEQQQTRAITEQPTTFLMGSENDVKLYEGNYVVDYNGIDGNPLEEGSYIITVPTAAFKTSDGKVTRGGSFTVTVNADGEVNTTGIENVEAKESKPAVDVIYDLQGRRVSRATRGLYIINGRKVLR